MDTNDLQHLTDDVAAEHAAALADHASRRGFLRALGFGGLAAGAAAAGGSLLSGVASAADTTTTVGVVPIATGTTTTAVPATTTTAPPRSPTTDDLRIIAFVQSIELAIVQVYANAESSAKLDPAVLAPVATFREHHREYADAFTSLAGTATVGLVNQSFVKKYGAPLISTSDPKVLLQGLLTVERVMTATYESYLSQIASTSLANLVASIMAIEGRQAVVLGQALGLPLAQLSPSFQNIDGAAKPADFPITL